MADNANAAPDPAAAAADDGAAVDEDNPMLAYFENTLQMDNQTMRNRFVTSGIDSPDAMVQRDKDWVYTCCKSLRTWAGNPINARLVTANMEELLYCFILWCRYRYLVQRPLDLDNATVVNIKAVRDWFKQQPEDPDANDLDKFTDNSNKRIWFESLEAFFATKKGSAGVPLIYVIRPNVAVPAVDEGFMRPSLTAEVKLRTQHDGHFWEADNRRVWLILSRLCHGTTSMSTIKRHEESSNGRGAWISLMAQYLGRDVQNLLCSQAELFLQHARFDATSKNFTFDKFINRLRQAFDDLGTDEQLTDSRKVLKLLRAWQVSSLSHLDSTIAADPNMSSDFEAAVTFLKSQLLAQQEKNKGIGNRRAAALNSNSMKYTKGGDDDPDARDSYKRPHKKGSKAKFKQKGNFDPKNPGAYLKHSVWIKLTDAQKKASREARVANGIPTRKVSALSRGKEVPTDNDGDVIMTDKVDESCKSQTNNFTRSIRMTQRAECYKSKGRKGAPKRDE